MFCGQQTKSGEQTADEPLLGIPFLTGSEEERGPLFDVTGVPFEGSRSPIGFGTQGHKIGAQGVLSEESVPDAVPVMVVRVRDRIIASMPAEPTVEVGRRIHEAVLSAAGTAGIKRVIVAGYANEYLSYLTTPEEYDRQHYEGGSTLYGPFASVLLTEQLGELAGRMARGEPAQAPFPFDPRNGVVADGEPFPAGAAKGTAESQPAGRVFAKRNGGVLVARRAERL